LAFTQFDDRKGYYFNTRVEVIMYQLLITTVGVKKRKRGEGEEKIVEGREGCTQSRSSSSVWFDQPLMWC